MDEQNPKQSGLNIEVPETDVQLSNGSVVSDVKLNSGADNNVDVEQQVFDMDKLSVSNPVKYLVTYNSPHEWILDQREAETAQMLRDTAMPEQASKVGSIAYSAGEMLRKTGNVARDFSEYAAGVDAYLLPNADKDIAERAYKNMKKLSVQTENNRADYVSLHGVDPDVYGIGTNVMEVARDMVLTAGVAGAVRRGATKAAYGYATSRLAPTATDVATRFAAQQGKKAASRAAMGTIAGETFMREAGDRATQQAAQYMDATGDYDLKYYDPTVDLALNTGVSAINSAIEMSLGIERIVPDMLFGTRGVGRAAEEFIKGYISERSEEFLQNFFDQLGDVASGYRENIDLLQAWNDSAAAGWIGGVFGSGTAAGMYYLNRRRMIRQLEESGIEKDTATKFVDKYLQDGINKTLSNMSSTVELRTKDGPAYDKLKAGIKNALVLQGWNEKMIDPQTGKSMDIDAYVDTLVNKDFINRAVTEALTSGVSIDDWLDVAQFTAIDNVLYVRPLGTAEDIQKRIDEADAVIKRQLDLKKTGAENAALLQEARSQKAVLQKLKANKILDSEIERVSIQEAKTPEIQKEIDTATSDADTLGKANSAADFVGGLENMTDEEKTRRLGNALLKRIFGNDTRGFDAIMTKPEYANVRAAINSSAAKIFDYLKNHRAYGIAKDLRDALKMLPNVKSGNFINVVTTPDLTGEDPVARNAFLYNFVFNDANTTAAFIDAYLTRAEESITNQTKVRLGKKDIIGQAFKAMDSLMQTQADVAGLQYNSIYNEDGSVADPNVAAVVASWQNLFVEVPSQQLYQIGYASMRGEMVGDYIDANLWAHTGEGPNVKGWGNYFLADFKINKKRYYDKFNREGPKVKYDGKDIDDLTLHGVGIFHPDIKRLIKDRIDDLSVTKKMMLDTVNRQVKRDSDVYQLNIDTVIDRVKDTVGEEKARKIIADMEKMLTKRGGPFMSLLSPFSPEAYPEIARIQKKYLKKGSLTQFDDDYVTVYNELVSTFGGERVPETSYASWFAHQFSSLNELKQSAEALKKLDFDKFSGRTGFLYKGEDFYDWLEGKIRKSEARHIAWAADAHRYDIRQKVYNAVRNAFVQNTTIDEQINKIEDQYITPWLEIKSQLKSVIEQNIEKEKSRFPDADVKAVKKFLFDFIDKPDLEKWPSDGMVYQDWWKDDSTQADRDLIDAVTAVEDHGIESPKGEPDMIIGLMNGVREANAKKRIFDAAKNALKNVKKEDFVFKPRASMYKTDKIPENDELLDYGKRLNKQPKKIQEGIRKLIAENQENIPWLAEMSDVGFADNTTEIFPEYAISDLFDLDIDPRSHVSPKILSIADTMKSDRYAGKPEEVKKRMIGLATDATVVAMLKHPDRQATIDDIAKQIDILKELGDVWGTGLHLTQSEKQTNKDFDKLADFLKKGLFAYGRKGTDAANTISKWFDVSRVELKAINGFNFFKRLDLWLNAHPEVVNKYKSDTSLGLTKDANGSELFSKLLLKYGIRGIRYWGDTDKRGFVTFEPTKPTQRLYSLDFQSPEPLVATHAISKEGMEQALNVGGFAMPSLAITKDIDANTYGDIVFVAPASMAQPSRTTRVYDRDAWTPMIDFIEYTAKEGFADRVKDILPPGADWSMFVSNIEDKANSWPEDNIMAKQLFAIYKGFPEEEVPFIQRKFDENNDLRKEYLQWYQDFVMSNMQGRIFRGFTPTGTRRYAPVTLDNIVRELKTQPEHKDFSYYDFYGFHDVARELVTRFKTPQDIKKEQGRIQDTVKVHDQEQELQTEFYSLASELNAEKDVTSRANSHFALANALLDTEGTLAERLERHGFKNDQESVKAVEDVIKKIKKMPVRYFEVKPQRAIRFNEFSAVFVPSKQSYDEIAERLTEQGANVLRYGSKEERAAMFDELVNGDDTIMFQGRRSKINGVFDPELGTILVGKNFNGTTLPHEMAHYWLDTIFKMFKRVQAGEIEARPEWVAQKREMFAMLGINENQTSLTRGQQEKFATMLEAYISGVGVTNEITRTFNDYLKWVPEKYRNLQQLSYIDENGKIQNVFLDAKAVEFFNKWYENPTLPSLSTSPERQRFMNVTGDDGRVIRVSIKEINDREKEFAQDAEEQLHTDQRLYNTLDENMPADIKSVADAQKVSIAARSNFLKTTEETQKKIITPDEDRKRRWFERKSRETEAQLAQDYIEKKPDHAHEVIFGDPELIPNDTGIDRATLINTYMALNNVAESDPDWARLQTNIAINQSLAGTQLALSNDKSYRVYLDGLREIEDVLEMKAATNYAGSAVGARERFNTDIQQFLSKELPAVFATEAGSEEREIALKKMFEKARTIFSGNTTGQFLTQMDMEYAKAQKRNTDAFVKWAEKVIKTQAGAKLNAEQQAHLLKISAKAQQALQDIDNKDAGVAVAGALELRNWQLEKQKLMGVAPKKFSLFGDYAPRAMLASPNTLLFANIPSTALNTLVTNVAKRGELFGENKVSDKLISNEIKRIKKIYGATSMNLAQMEKPTSPSLLHGEKYSAAGQKWYDPYTILGREDNFFRVPTFVNTLARIASKDAKATGRSADEVFLEYIKLNDQSDSAKLARKQALAVANMAVFTQNGALARCLNHIRSELNYLSRVPLGLDPHGFGAGSLIAPFLTTGANIAEMGIRGAIAPITTLTTYAQALRTGKAIDPLKKLALRMDWTYFVFSVVSMALLAALTSDDDEFYIDPYKTGMGYDPDRPYDSINIGGVWVDLDFFGPFSIPMRTAAKVIQAWKKDNGIGTALLSGYSESAKSVLGDIPLAESLINNQFEWAMKKPGAFAGSYAYNQANKLVPAGIKPISRALSRGQGWMLRPFEGTTVGRKFNRNYGFDGQELTSQDLLEMFTIKFQLGKDAQQYVDSILGLQ